MNKDLKQRKSELFKFKSKKKRQKFLIEFKHVNRKDFPFFLKNVDHSARKTMLSIPLRILKAERNLKMGISKLADNFSKLAKELQEKRVEIKKAMLEEDTEKLSELLQQKARTSLAINGIFGSGKRLYQGLPILITKRGSGVILEPLMKESIMDTNIEIIEPVELAAKLLKYTSINHNEGFTVVLENTLAGILFNLIKTKGTRFDLGNNTLTKDGEVHLVTQAMFEDKDTYLLFENSILGFWNHFDFVRKGYTVHEYLLTEDKVTKLIRLTIKVKMEEYTHVYTFIIRPEYIKNLPMKDLKVI